MDSKEFNDAVKWVRRGFEWRIMHCEDVRRPGTKLPSVTEQLYDRSRVVCVACDTRDGHLRIEDVVKRSREPGGAVEWDALSLLAQWGLSDGEPLNPALANWVCDVLRGKAPRRGKRQRPPATARQAVIVDAIEWLMKPEYHPPEVPKPKHHGRNISPEGTGGRGSCCAEGGSGIDVVGVALGEYMPEWKSDPPKYKTVADIWQRRRSIRSRWDRENPPPRRFGDTAAP